MSYCRVNYQDLAGSRHARGSCRRYRPLAHRPGLQGIADQHQARRPDGADGSGRTGQGARRSTRRQISDLILGCGLPGGEQGYNMARVVAVMLGYDSLPGTTITRYCSSSLQSTRMAFHAIKAGEGDIYISAGVETVSRFAQGQQRRQPDTKNPVFADAEASAAGDGQGRLHLARPARGRQDPGHLHRDGPDRRERRPAARDQPRRSRTSSASGRRTSPRRRWRTVSGSATSRRSRCRTAPSSPPTTARGPERPWRRCPSSSRCSARTAP